MLTRHRVEKVTFSKPFTIESIGMELPAGTYSVTVEEHTEVLAGAHPKKRERKIFHLPPGLLGADHPGATASLGEGQLEEAQKCDRE